MHTEKGICCVESVTFVSNHVSLCQIGYKCRSVLIAIILETLRAVIFVWVNETGCTYDIWSIVGSSREHGCNSAEHCPAEIQQRFRRKKMDTETQTELVLSAVYKNNIINIECCMGYCEYRLFSNGSMSLVETITESPHMWQKIRIYSNPYIISFLHAILPLWSAQTR